MKELIDVNRIKKEFEKLNKYNINKEYSFFYVDGKDIFDYADFVDENVGTNNKQLYVKKGRNHIIDIADRGGFFILCCEKNTLISIASVDVVINKSKFQNHSILSSKKELNSVVLDTVVVNKNYRNQKLMEISIILLEYYSLQKGYKNAFTMISPHNYYAVTGIVNTGFYIYSLAERDAGKRSEKEEEKNTVKRYLAHLPLGKKRADVEEQYTVKNTEYKWQEEVIELGFCGFKTINYKDMDDFFLSYSMMYYD